MTPIFSITVTKRLHIFYQMFSLSLKDHFSENMWFSISPKHWLLTTKSSEKLYFHPQKAHILNNFEIFCNKGDILWLFFNYFHPKPLPNAPGCRHLSLTSILISSESAPPPYAPIVLVHRVLCCGSKESLCMTNDWLVGSRLKYYSQGFWTHLAVSLFLLQICNK